MAAAYRKQMKCYFLPKAKMGWWERRSPKKIGQLTPCNLMIRQNGSIIKAVGKKENKCHHPLTTSPQVEHMYLSCSSYTISCP